MYINSRLPCRKDMPTSSTRTSHGATGDSMRMGVPSQDDFTLKTPHSVQSQAANSSGRDAAPADDMLIATHSTDSFERVPPSPSHYHPDGQKIAYSSFYQ